MDSTGIKGLPEGAEWSGDFLPSGADDYELMKVMGETYIAKGARPGAATATKVVPQAGYTFLSIGYEPVDVRTMQRGREKFAVTKLLGNWVNDEKGVPQFVAQPKVTTITLKFSESNELQAGQLEAAIKGFADIPGYVGMERA